jgi:hypothetical protein
MFEISEEPSPEAVDAAGDAFGSVVTGFARFLFCSMASTRILSSKGGSCML